MEKRFWIIVGVIVAVFAGILWFGGNKEDDTTSSGSKAQPTNHVLGNPQADVKLVEYGDYQCPFCSVFHPVTKQVIEKYSDKISFQYRHFPLGQHQNAFAATRAAEAAHEQGKFWEMHDMIFASQQSWSQSSTATRIFEGYAQQLKLDLTKYKKDFASSEVNARINADRAEFNKTKLTPSTPTFILNGEKIQPKASLESFSEIIDEALEKEN